MDFNSPPLTWRLSYGLAFAMFSAAMAFTVSAIFLRFAESGFSLLDALQRRHCLFFHRSATVVHSHDAELVAAIRGGEALVTGLSGDAWTRLIGDTFT